MSYYTQRHGLRKPVQTTYTISPSMYELLFKCCEKYYNNIAWKYPEQCKDRRGCCGLDEKSFWTDLEYEVPDLLREWGKGIIPSDLHYPSDKTDFISYNQYALLDYIEFFAQNCRDVALGDYHSYFSHYHLICKTTDVIYSQFQKEINEIFEKTGLLYRLTDEKIIERIVENSPLTPMIEEQIAQIKEAGTRQLLQEAIKLHTLPYPESARDAVEKIWDALERLKTYYTTLDKKASAGKIVNDMAGGEPHFSDLFNEEFIALTKIGNSYRIRHHETDKVDITDPRHYDYFFNRCLSLIALAIQYLQ